MSGRGRIGRGRFWLVLVLIWIVFGVCGAVAELSRDAPSLAFLLILLIPLMLAALPVGIFNTVKRLHDLGLSGWWILAQAAVAMVVGMLVVLAGLANTAAGVALSYIPQIAILLLLGGLPGQRGPNRFGDPPGGAPELQPAA